MAPELGKGSWECLCEMGLEQALKEVGHSLQALGWVGGIWNLAQAGNCSRLCPFFPCVPSGWPGSPGPRNEGSLGHRQAPLHHPASLQDPTFSLALAPSLPVPYHPLFQTPRRGDFPVVRVSWRVEWRICLQALRDDVAK